MKIDIWSDIVCPFCYIGKRHLERALDAFPHRDDVQVVWHSFELDPHAERVVEGTLPQMIAGKYGISEEQAQASQEDIARRAAAVGLEFAWRDARPGNTFDAHRIVHLAAGHGLADAAHERLMRAYFTEGVAVGDPAELQRLAEEIGLPADEVRDVLAGDRFADDVRADEARARGLGITGVPFFVLDDRYGVSGAQPIELFEQALAQAWAESHPVLTRLGSPAGAATGEQGTQDAPAGGPACDGDHCTI